MAERRSTRSQSRRREERRAGWIEMSTNIPQSNDLKVDPPSPTLLLQPPSPILPLPHANTVVMTKMSTSEKKHKKALAQARLELAKAQVALLEAEDSEISEGEEATVKFKNSTPQSELKNPQMDKPVGRHNTPQPGEYAPQVHKQAGPHITSQAPHNRTLPQLQSPSPAPLVPLPPVSSCTGGMIQPAAQLAATHSEDGALGLESLHIASAGNVSDLTKGAQANNQYVPQPYGQVGMDGHTNATQVSLNLSELVNIISQATRSSQSPRFISELPQFSGQASEWLHFKAAYTESENFYNDFENITRLRKSLVGLAKESVACLFLGNTPPSEVIKKLESRFGRPEALVISEMEKLKLLNKLSDNCKETDICIFASKVINVVAAVEALGRTHHLYNPEMVRLVEDRLTPILRTRWYDFESNTSDTEPGLIKLSRFLSREADINARHARVEKISKDPKLFKTLTTQATTDLCGVCKEIRHGVVDCTTFKSATVEERWEIAKRLKLCFRCLKRRTWQHRCRARQCSMPGCEHYHHRLLHGYSLSSSAASPGETTASCQCAATHIASDMADEDVSEDEPVDESTAESAVVASTWAPRPERIYLRVLPVRVSGPKGEVEAFALLDDGSTVTLLTNNLAEQIGAEGPSDPFYIEAVAGTRVEAANSRRVVLKVSCPFNTNNTVELAARTIDHLDLSGQSVSMEVLTGCNHLEDIADQLTYREGMPSVLIGQDNWELLVASEIRRGLPGQPVASRTPLGWVLHGRCASNYVPRVHHINKIKAHLNSDDEIKGMLEEHFSLESLGVAPRRPQADPDERALRILQETTKALPGGGYETGLLWKNNDIVIPNNYDATLKRLVSVERKLNKNPHLKIGYKTQINNMLECGYAEMAPTETQPGKTWYLPHFAVLNPAKPNKVRIVHDAAARTRGICLNDLLLTGPDMLQSLPGVLMRFRQKAIAVAADIKDMFLRIEVRESDRDALRFLWREGDDTLAPKEYRMKSVIFGATSSPCTAIFVKNHNAQCHKNEYPEAVKSIVRHHYMDDYLESFSNISDAKRIINAVVDVHRHARFELHRWSSNEPVAIEGLAATRSGEFKDGFTFTNTTEKILGMMWQPSEDTLGYNLDFSKVEPALLNQEKTPTKRDVLRAAMSVYDPIGLVSPVTIQAKFILQESWRHQLKWDEPLPELLLQRWTAWLSSLSLLRQLKLKRCYTAYDHAVHLELHTFVDASELAYAAASYWRVIDANGKVYVTLAAVKSRVAPLKVVSIPRLELQGAVLGSRLARTVIEEHERSAQRVLFWSDSRTVLAWLRAGARAFKPFVAHRVAELEENTIAIGAQWRWVPTQCNVADDATRTVPANFDPAHRWFTGPDFLYQVEALWPQEPDSLTRTVTGEERVASMLVAALPANQPCLTNALPRIERFSSWLRLIRSTARVLQFIARCRPHMAATTHKRSKHNDNNDPVWRPQTARRPRQLARHSTHSQMPSTPRHIALPAQYTRAAELIWTRALQQQSFTTELDLIKCGRKISSQSRLRQLSLVLDNTGVLRIHSRVDAAINIDTDQRSPAVLDGNHPYCRLYIHWVHIQLHHSGVESVTNEIRQRYWILRLRPTVRTVLKQCLPCRIRRATPPEPITGNLPACRLAHHQRPFTYTGVDYFGPLSVTVGRNQEKRYVALFTCLTTRALHLEIAGSLSTDSAIMALRRMMARRGCPDEIWSDNGSNFRGADAELRKAAQGAMEEYADIRSVQWRYIPPGAPFMGGAWERLVRSVKTALTATLHQRYPKEEVLHTLLTEIEHTVNSRPLTHVSVSSQDPEALTPNHLLFGGISKIPLPGVFVERDANLRSMWRASQRLADVFWQRWIREALPLLQTRREPHGDGRGVNKGDMVIVVDSSLPRNSWPRGIVEAVYPGSDGIVRTVDVRHKGGMMRRAVKKCIVLPLMPE